MPAQKFLHKPRYTSIFAEDEINISNILDYFKLELNIFSINNFFSSYNYNF